MKRNDILRTKYERGILNMGYRKVESRTLRYWIYYRPSGGVNYIFLGKAGAVRGGKTARVDMSFPLSPRVKAELLKKGEEQFALTS